VVCLVGLIIKSMGGCGSSNFSMNPADPSSDLLAMSIFKELGLSNRQIRKLHNIFVDIDLNQSGYLRRDEFFAAFHLEDTRCNEEIFGSFDIENKGKLNFCEFVCAMWNLLTLEPSDLGYFVFTIFDRDNSGVLKFEEMKDLVETIHHKNYDKNIVIQRLVHKLLESSADVTMDHFVQWSQHHPSILAPLISLQDSLQGYIGGHRFWNDLYAKRRQVCQHPLIDLSATNTPEKCFRILYERTLDLSKPSTDGIVKP
jgi:Ca2+-binding EF-hand superfamily protein